MKKRIISVSIAALAIAIPAMTFTAPANAADDDNWAALCKKAGRHTTLNRVSRAKAEAFAKDHGEAGWDCIVYEI